jgi:hypothetical protein
MVYDDCKYLKKALGWARTLLATPGEIVPAGFTGAPYFFDRADRKFGPEHWHTPRVHAMGGGWKHTFYGWDGVGYDPKHPNPPSKPEHHKPHHHQ